MKKTIAMMLALCLVLTTLCGMAFADAGYQVQVVDSAGYPIQGVMVQFCSDSQCMMGKTGEDGIASFDAPAGSYTVHLLKVPVGYEKDTREYTVPETPALMTLTLNQEGLKEQAVAAKGGHEKDAEKQDVIDEPMIGLHYVMPEQLRGMKGSLVWSADFLNEGLLDISVEYYAVAEEDMESYYEYGEKYIDAYFNGGDLPVGDDPSWMSGYERAYLYDILIANEDCGELGIRALLYDLYGMDDEYISDVTEIGSDGDCHFFLVEHATLQDDLAEYRNWMGEFFPEFESLVKNKDVFLSGLTLKAPEWPDVVEIGVNISFKTADLAGNPIDSAELFARSKVTMINCWATWCGPCKGELPELGQMAKEFEAQGCRIIGLCMDADDNAVAATASAILADAGAGYLNLRCTDEIDEMLQLQAYPTTFFVDSEGRVLVAPIEGADLDGYRVALREALALVG